MSYSLVLNSSNVIGTNNNSFQYNFISGSFKAENAEISISSVVIPNSFYNVASMFANNTVTLIFPRGSTTVSLPITFPDGNYSVTDLQNYIQQQCIANNFYLVDNNGNYVYYTYLSYAPNYYKIQLLCSAVPTSLSTGWTLPTLGASGTGWVAGLPTGGFCPQVQLASTGSISTIIGYVPGASYPAVQTVGNTNFLSTLTPQGSIVNSLVARCSMVKNNITAITDILDGIPISSAFGYNINYNPSFERWVKVADGTYSNFTITFSDQNLNTLYARDPNVAITLLIKNNVKK